VRITVGKKAAEDVVEYKLRTWDKAEDKPADSATAEAVEYIQSELNK